MFDVRTPLKRLHRPVRQSAGTFTATPGLWGYIDNNEKINNIANTSTNQTQPEILKPIFGNASLDPYASNDIEVGRIATLEGLFRAVVDGDGFQRTVAGTGTQATTAVAYTDGMELTVAYRVTTATATTSYAFSKASDIGKLKPKWFEYETVVAVVERFNSSTGQLKFRTVTPHKTGVNIITGIIGTGSLVTEEPIFVGVSGFIYSDITGSASLSTEEAVLAGSAFVFTGISASDGVSSEESTMAGAGWVYTAITASDALASEESTGAGVGSVYTSITASDALASEEAVGAGTGAVYTGIGGSGPLASEEPVLAGAGAGNTNVVGSGGLSAQSAGVQNS